MLGHTNHTRFAAAHCEHEQCPRSIDAVKQVMHDAAELVHDAAELGDTMHSLEHEVRCWRTVLACVRMGPHGEYVLHLGDEHHDARVQLAFMLDVGEAMEQHA